MLPPLKRPTSLTTHSSVVQLLEHAEATDLSKLEELDTTMLRHSLFVSGNDEGITSDAQETLFTKQHFILRRCRTLRRLKMESLGNGNLRWAVDEKRLVEQNGQDTLLPAPFQTEEGNQQTTSNPEHGREGLVPLEEFEIETVYGRLTDDTDLAAIAFSQTLKIIKVYYYGTYGGGSNPTRHHFIKHLSSFVGRQWVHMPLLTHFSVSMGLAGLVIDPQLLLNIPNAISVLLSDETAVYLLEDIDTCLPAYLPSLKSLTLRGLPALSFHPDTLHSTDQLTELSYRLPLTKPLRPMSQTTPLYGLMKATRTILRHQPVTFHPRTNFIAHTVFTMNRPPLRRQQQPFDPNGHGIGNSLAWCLSHSPPSLPSYFSSACFKVARPSKSSSWRRVPPPQVVTPGPSPTLTYLIHKASRSSPQP
jgi:hypothetical protein